MTLVKRIKIPIVKKVPLIPTNRTVSPKVHLSIYLISSPELVPLERRDGSEVLSLEFVLGVIDHSKLPQTFKDYTKVCVGMRFIESSQTIPWNQVSTGHPP
jgi:hypothetical protein